jgi:hypothetical protein
MPLLVVWLPLPLAPDSRHTTMTVAPLFSEPFFHLVTFGFIADGGEQGFPNFFITAVAAKD